MPVSLLTLPIRLNRRQLEAKINEQFGSVLYDEYDEAKGIHTKAELLAPVGLIVEPDYFAYRVPVRVHVQKKTGFIQGAATGAVQMDLRTDYHIGEDWTIKTTTELERHEWLEKPKLNIGGINLGVGWIADQVLPRIKDRLGKTVDEQIAQTAQLREQIEKVWEQLNKPQPAPGELVAFTEINPKTLRLSPLENDGENVLATLFISAEPHVFVGTNPPDSPDTPLPPFRTATDWKDKGTDIYLKVDVLLAAATEMARAQMVGQTIEAAGREITIHDLRLSAQGNRLRVDTSTSGLYKGTVTFLTIPRANAHGNLELDEFDVDLETRNILFRAAEVFFKGPMRRKMHEQVESQLNAQLEEMRRTVRQQLQHQEVAPDVVMQGELHHLQILSAEVLPDRLRLEVRVAGEVKILV